MEKPLTGKVALVTGGSRGIGAATASVLAQREFRVVVNYHASAQDADEVVAAISAAGGEAVAMQADVTAAGDVARMVGATLGVAVLGAVVALFQGDTEGLRIAMLAGGVVQVAAAILCWRAVPRERA